MFNDIIAAFMHTKKVISLKQIATHVGVLIKYFFYLHMQYFNNFSGSKSFFYISLYKSNILRAILYQ